MKLKSKCQYHNSRAIDSSYFESTPVFLAAFGTAIFWCARHGALRASATSLALVAPYLHHSPRRWTWPVSYLLSEQSYALCSLKFSSRELGRFAPYFYAGTAVAMWLTWQLSVFAGVYLGASIPETWSLTFAVPLSFLATRSEHTWIGEPGGRSRRWADRGVGHKAALHPRVGNGFRRWSHCRVID
jgi:hypothetical protein